MALSSGENLKKKLGLENFKSAYIQRIVNVSVPMFVVIIDSKFPTRFISRNRIKRAQSFVLRQIKGVGGNSTLNKVYTSPPVDLDHFSGVIPSRSIIIRIDLVGEYFLRDQLYEPIDEK